MKLFFRKYGEGRPIIILHGLFGQSDNWNSLAKQFSEQGLLVYTVDQRNHGLSPHDAHWNYSLMADDLMELIESENLNNPIIIGHSMGGKTCMFFEYKYRGLASKLIVVDISPRKYESRNFEVVEALNRIDLHKIQSRKEAENILTSSGLDFGTRQFLLKNLFRNESPLYNESLFGWRFNLPVITSQFKNVGEEVPDFSSETPVLFLRGDRSDYINDEDIQLIKQRFLRSEVKTIQGSGHWIHAEQPGLFFDAVMSFLSQ